MLLRKNMLKVVDVIFFPIDTASYFVVLYFVVPQSLLQNHLFFLQSRKVHPDLWYFLTEILQSTVDINFSGFHSTIIADPVFVMRFQFEILL